jgi:tetratricopeptide (TPR) repeat protein
MAGERAMEAAAFEDAAAHYQHALSLGPTEEATRAALLEGLAGALRSVGKWDEALATMDQALEVYQRLQHTDAIGRLCWAMVYHLTWAARFEEAVTLAERGLAALGDARNPDRARLLSVTGWVTGLAGDHATATHLFETARSLAEELGDRRALADVLHMKSPHHMGYVEFEEGITAGLEAAAVFEAEGELWDLCGALAFVEFQQGTILLQEEAGELAERLSPLTARLGHVGAEFLNLADRLRRDAIMVGDLARIEALAHQVIDVCRRGNLPWLYTGHLHLGLVAHWDGRWDEAERELRRAIELEPPGAFGGQSATHLALHLAELGRAEAVMELFEGAQGKLARAGRVNSLGAWNTLLGFTEALYLTERRAEVAALGPLVLEALALGEWVTFDCRFVSTRAGIAAAVAGRWDQAEAYFSAALELASRLGHRIEQAGVLRLRAKMLTDRGGAGDRDHAASLIHEAADLFREMGMQAKARQIEASLVPTSTAKAEAHEGGPR